LLKNIYQEQSGVPFLEHSFLQGTRKVILDKLDPDAIEMDIGLRHDCTMTPLMGHDQQPFPRIFLVVGKVAHSQFLEGVSGFRIWF
jgi:hypothetical protein